MKLLSELTAQELDNLFEKNSFFRDQVSEYAARCVDDQLSEYLRPFFNNRAVDYNIGYPGDFFHFDIYCGSYDAYYNFFAACKALTREYCIFTDSTQELLNRFYAREGFYLEAIFGNEDITDHDQERITAWIDKKVIAAACDDILTMCKAEYDLQFDDDYLRETADIYVEMYGNDYATDGEYIYETTVRRYA